MKTKNSFLLILCLLLFSSLHAQNEPVKILAIGNSFADDGIEYLDEIAISAGKHIIVANTYIGGCSIQRHLDNARHDKHDYKYRKKYRWEIHRRKREESIGSPERRGMGLHCISTSKLFRRTIQALISPN